MTASDAAYHHDLGTGQRVPATSELSRSSADRLIVAVEAFRAPAFAVLDGAHFDNLPGLLRTRRFFARSLFLDHADIDAERAGPWLVPLQEKIDAATLIIDVVAGRPAVVFWSCTGGEAVLYRHLRTINAARLPLSGSTANSPEIHTPVLFRHWDPRVLSVVLPLLDAGQFAKVHGPASDIAFAVGDQYVRRSVFDESWPTAPPGVLTISGAQRRALDANLTEQYRSGTVRWLREHSPEDIAHLDDSALRAAVVDAERSGWRMGLESGASHRMWAWLCVSSNGKAGRDPALRRHMRDTSYGANPDERLDKLWDALTHRFTGRHGSSR